MPGGAPGWDAVVDTTRGTSRWEVGGGPKSAVVTAVDAAALEIAACR